MKRAAQLLIVPLFVVAGCSPGELERGDEVSLLQTRLDEGLTLTEACRELEVLCKVTGFGCKAYELFCGGPTKDLICRKLWDACELGDAAACKIHGERCGAGCPACAADAGPVPRDLAPPLRSDGPKGDSWVGKDPKDPYPRDAGPYYTNDGYLDDAAPYPGNPYPKDAAASDL